MFELTKFIREKCAQKFIEILNSIRIGKPTDFDLLAKCKTDNYKVKTDTTLFYAENPSKSS